MVGKMPAGLERREFLRRAALTAAWTAPAFQIITARGAYAASGPGCDHSACVAACNKAADDEGRKECKRMGRCNDFCKALCPTPPGTCPCSAACQSGNFTFSNDCVISLANC